MATTAKGTPYVISTDLVANYPTVSSDLADHIDDKLAYNAVTINAQTGTTYTFALADASEGKLVTASNAASQTYTVPPQSSVTWAAGAVLRILNQGAGTVTIAAGSGVTINGTPLTLAQYKGAAIQRTAADTWTFIPFSGGVGNAVISDTPTGSYTGYQYWAYTASGTLNVGTAGFADVLVIGGGSGGGGGVTNGGGGGGGGAGGYLEIGNAYLPSGALTVVVGAGGAGGVAGAAQLGGLNGVASRIGSYYGVGGGGGAVARLINGFSGGSGGGSWSTAGAGTSGQGNDGGTGTIAQGGNGGGGGASAVGASTVTASGGNGGAGSSNSYTGAAVTRAGGGGGGRYAAGTAGSGGAGGGGNAGTGTTAGTAGSANTGGGGGAGSGQAADSGAGGAGGSGIVIIRVAV